MFVPESGGEWSWTLMHRLVLLVCFREAELKTCLTDLIKLHCKVIITHVSGPLHIKSVKSEKNSHIAPQRVMRCYIKFVVLFVANPSLGR